MIIHFFIFFKQTNKIYIFTQTICMKNRIIFFLILSLFCLVLSANILHPVFAMQNIVPLQSQDSLYKYKGQVPHFFTHQIINDPQKAFASKLKKHYDKDCITHTEFKNFLTEMYNNNFCLVDIFDVVSVENGNAKLKDVFVPLGKKPFLLSFDDLSYDSIGIGLSDKIILDSQNKIASFTRSNTPQIEYDKEAICILESFIQSHPDFSFKGARAVLCPTGYDGILGYRINKDGYCRKKDLAQIVPLIDKLKQLNYHFASHSYGHIQVKYATASELKTDLEKYRDEIITTIGNTNLFCFPCGSGVSQGEKLDILKNFGYNIFFGVGDTITCQKNDCVFLKRQVLNGVTLRTCQSLYSPFFDTNKVYDHKFRTIPFA